MTAAVLLLSASAALAEGGLALPPPPPVVIASDRCPASFDCAYGGLVGGRMAGDWHGEAQGDRVVEQALDSTAAGLVAGYNWQRGALVYGGEVQYMRFDGDAPPAGGGFVSFRVAEPRVGFRVDDVLDLRARVGVAAGQALVYGAVGYSTGNATAMGGGLGIDGVNIGAGVEVNVTGRVFVGLDYTARQMDGTRGVVHYEGDVDTVTLRAGLRF